MDILETMLEDGLCVYWANEGLNPDGSGNPQYGPPDEIPCRWEDKNEAFINQKGQQMISKSVVFVGEDLTFEGVLWKGSLNDLTDPDNPMNNEGALPIQAIGKLPTLHQEDEEFLRTVWL